RSQIERRRHLHGCIKRRERTDDGEVLRDAEREVAVKSTGGFARDQYLGLRRGLREGGNRVVDLKDLEVAHREIDAPWNQVGLDSGLPLVPLSRRKELAILNRIGGKVRITAIK